MEHLSATAQNRRALQVTFALTFGYFIAWKNEAVRAYYGGSDPGSFVAHISNLLRAEPLLFLLLELSAEAHRPACPAS